MFTYHRAVHWCLSPHQTQVFYSAKSSNIINCQTHNSKWIIPQHWPSEYCVNINFVHKARYQHLHSWSTPCQPKVTNLLNKERQTLLPLSQVKQVVGFTQPSDFTSHIFRSNSDSSTSLSFSVTRFPESDTSDLISHIFRSKRDSSSSLPFSVTRIPDSYTPPHSQPSVPEKPTTISISIYQIR